VIGCEHAQGYYFSRPLRRDKVDRMLASGPPWQLDGRRISLGFDA
jgi:predicted signal transduction protein with EAL and GGDEF domain